MIADLSQAYGDQTSSASSEITSPPSTVDGDEREEPQQAPSPQEEQRVLPQTVAMSDMHMPAATGLDHASSKSPTHAQDVAAKGQGPIDISYGKDLGLDDIFDYFRFD